MKPRIHIAVATLGLMSVFAAAPLALAGQAHEDLAAHAHQGGAIDRTVVIDDKTKWVNVTENETVRFIVGGKSFAWLFDRYDQGSDLNKMAPKGMLGDRSVKVYVGVPVPQ